MGLRCRLGCALEASLELGKAHSLDGYDEGESSGLPLALQEAQVAYGLAQQFLCLGS
jgi:hypothetical protein